MRNGLLKTLLFLSLFSGVAAAETVYVHDQLRLGVRAAPNAAEKSVAVVKTGDALTVLGEQDNFINIRTESGLEGWVSKGYVSTEPPAKNLLQAARKEVESLKQQQVSLKQELEQGAKSAAEQQLQLTQLQGENAKLKQQLDVYEEVEGDEVTEIPPALIGLILLASGLLAGLFIGVRWKARRVAERIGGLEI